MGLPRPNTPSKKRASAPRKSGTTSLISDQELPARINQGLPSNEKDLLLNVEIYNLLYAEQKGKDDAIDELTFLRNFHRFVTESIESIRQHKSSTVNGRPSAVPKYLLLLLTKGHFLSNREQLPNAETLSALANEWINKNKVNRDEWTGGKKSNKWTCSVSSARDFLSWLNRQNTTGNPWDKKSFCRFFDQYKR